MVTYLKRLAELAVVAGGSAFVSALVVDDAGFRAALTAGVAAAYGVLVKRFGDRTRPSAQ